MTNQAEKNNNYDPQYTDKSNFFTNLTQWLTGLWNTHPNTHLNTIVDAEFHSDMRASGVTNIESQPVPSVDFNELSAQYGVDQDSLFALRNSLSANIRQSLIRDNIEHALNQWHKLYENFRIGMQLGYQNFTMALVESGEDYPESDSSNLGSPWSWSTWERLAVNLLNNFDQSCAKEIESILQNPQSLISDIMVKGWMQSADEQAKNREESLLVIIAEVAQQEIDERLLSLKKQLTMSDSLANIIHNPATIAIDFETYLWANYITHKRIGNFESDLPGRLHISPRKAPAGKVAKRLQDLCVSEATKLDKISGHSANHQLKRLHDWAQSRVSRFKIWENIKLDSTRFRPRTSTIKSALPSLSGKVLNPEVEKAVEAE